jgi:hypothetical protein
VIAFICSALFFLVQQPAAIHGVLTDSSGAVIPAATISLSGGSVQRSVQTAADGSYSFPGLPPGDYTLKVDHPGLEGFATNARVEAGKALQVPIQLRPRVSTQVVTVTGDAASELSVDPAQSVGTRVVKDSDLDALPDNPDDLLDMLQALAGPGNGGGAQILIDNFAGGQIPSKNSIKEIRINQDPFSAAYQWYGYGRIEIVTKPGADTFHGTVGLTDSDAVFNSRNPYAANKADYVNRMFTATAGSSFRHRGSYSFNFYRNTINNTTLINAVYLDPSTLTEIPIRSTVVVPRTEYSGTGRLDAQISSNNTVTGSYRHLRGSRENNGVGQYSLLSRGYPSEDTMHELRVAETSVLSATVVAETRFGYTRYNNQQYGDTSTPSLIVSNAFNSGSAQVGHASDINAFIEVQNNTTVVRNAHTFRFGGQVRYRPDTNITPSNFGGTFQFFGVTNAPVLDANNQPAGNQTAPINSLEQYRRTLVFQRLGYSAALIRSLGGGASQFSIAAGNPRVAFSQTESSAYILDDWHARPSVTLSLGLRYEHQTNIHDWKDFAPRATLSWSPGTANNAMPKTVFRAGWGAFYAYHDTALKRQALRFNGTTEQQYIVLNPDFYPFVPATSSLPAGPSLTTYRLDPHLRAMPWMLAALSVERQLPGNTTLSVIYRNQRTTRLLQTVNVNAPLPGGIRPYGDAAGNIFQFESGGIQKVNWLTFQINNKLNQKISVSAQYSYMEAHNHSGYTDNGRWDNSMPSNPYNLNADWGQAGWLTKSNFNFFGTLTAPGGIQFSPLFVGYSSGTYNLTIGSDLNGDTVANDRPAFATDLSRPSVVRTKFGAFDTNPLPGQTIVPRNYLTGAPMWNLSLRVSKTLALRAGTDRYRLNFNVDANNLFNHVNQGGFVGNLASPLFGQSTGLNLFRDSSNNRRVQLGTQLTF